MMMFRKDDDLETDKQALTMLSLSEIEQRNDRRASVLCRVVLQNRLGSLRTE